MSFTVTAALITSLIIDHFGWFRIEAHPANVPRILGGILMIIGIFLISRN